MNSEEGVRGGISIHRACHQRPYSSSSSSCGDRTSRNGVAGGACGHRHLTRGGAARRRGRCRLPMVGGLPVGQGSLTSEWRWAVEADRDGDAAGTDDGGVEAFGCCELSLLWVENWHQSVIFGLK